MLDLAAWIWAIVGVDRRKKPVTVPVERRKKILLQSATKRLNESIDRFNETVTKKYESKHK